MFKVAGTSEYLAITGSGIQDIKLAKKAWIWPFQSFTIFDISPVNYSLDVHAMSAEKLPFILPAVFTIGPRDDHDSLLKYAKLLCSKDRNSKDVHDLVQGVIEGETRVLAASMTMEEVFRGTKEFKKEVFDKVQLELNQFGLLIYNANIKQLVDLPGHEYFSYLGRKIQNEAANQARIDISEAKMKGEIGSKKREGQTAQNAAQIDAETKIVTTQRIGEGKKEEIRVKSELEIFENQRIAEVATNKAQWSRQSQLAQVEAQKAVAIKEAELQKEVELKKALTRTEQLKAEFLSKASVEYDIKVQEANSVFYDKQKAAEAVLYEKEKAAEAQRKNAEAALFARQKGAEGELYAKKIEAQALMALAEAKLYAKQKEAEGELFAKEKEAEGVVAMAKAQGVYVQTLMGAFSGNYIMLRDFLMIKDGSYKDIAQINAGAVAGLKPNISVWTTGGQSAGSEDGGNSAMKEIAGLYRTLPPLLKTVQEQTGMNPPSWLATLDDSSSNKLALREP